VKLAHQHPVKKFKKLIIGVYNHPHHAEGLVNPKVRAKIGKNWLIFAHLSHI
jgi:hypothetical protein